MVTSPSVPAWIFSLTRRPMLDAAAAMAATRLGSAPLVRAWAMGRPSWEASSTPCSSGIALRSDSSAAFNASAFAILPPFESDAMNLGNRRAKEVTLALGVNKKSPALGFDLGLAKVFPLQ